MRVARGLATTCYVLYADTPTGVGPGEVFFTPPRNGGEGPYPQAKNFPEVEETVVLRGLGKGMGMGGSREQDYLVRGGASYLLRPEASNF